MNGLAPFWARAVGLVLDGSLNACVVLLLIGIGALPTEVFSVGPGWFWTDWLIRLWLDSPADLAIPAIAFCFLSAALNLVFERFDFGPSAWFLGLRVVDARGRPASWPRLFLRAIGVFLNFLTAGFGFLWMLVSRHHRGLADVISGTCVKRALNASSL